ncbi:MAG: hypothetical protein ACFB10_11985 [Salibacteraceae bacterium]
MSSSTAISNEGKRRTFFVMGTMGVSIGILLLDSLFFKGVLSAEIWGYGFTAVFLLYAIAAKDQLILKFLGFAVVAGLAELVADHYLVAISDTLIYPTDEPMLWSSPAYMPFSWTVVLIEFGFLGWLMARKMHPSLAGLLLGVLGALLVPLYEHWAIDAGWWSYKDTPMLGPVPIYVIIAEGLLMVPVPYLLLCVEKSSWLWILGLGLIEGAVMLLACILALAVV